MLCRKQLLKNGLPERFQAVRGLEDPKSTRDMCSVKLLNRLCTPNYLFWPLPTFELKSSQILAKTFLLFFTYNFWRNTIVISLRIPEKFFSEALSSGLWILIRIEWFSLVGLIIFFSNFFFNNFKIA